MDAIASQITSLTIVYSIVYADADQRKHQSSASLAFVRRIHRGPVNSPHKWPVTRKMFPFDDVIMKLLKLIRILGAFRYHLQIPNFQICCSFFLLTWMGTNLVEWHAVFGRLSRIRVQHGHHLQNIHNRHLISRGGHVDGLVQDCSYYSLALSHRCEVFLYVQGSVLMPSHCVNDVLYSIVL